MGEPSNLEPSPHEVEPTYRTWAGRLREQITDEEWRAAANPAGIETFHDVGRDLRAERKHGDEGQGDDLEAPAPHHERWLEATGAYNRAMGEAFAEYRRAISAGWELYREAKQTADLVYERARIDADAAWSTAIAEITNG